MARHQPYEGDRFQQAKKLFLANVGLLACLILGWVIIISSEEELPENEEVEIIEEPILSNLELATLKGEMQALSEHPGTMPEYEKEWVLKVSKQAVKRDPNFNDLDESTLIQLADAYFNAYTERFNEYFDPRSAREAGYRYGVKFNPNLHGFYPRGTWMLLQRHRARLAEEFYIPSEAEWRLFCEAFDKGFTQGYRIIDEDTTARSLEDEIKLFDHD